MANPVDDSDMDRFLGPDGGLAASIPHYEDRPQQRRMAAAVAETIAHDHSILIEAGTGTGKTLAYLIPALRSQKRVVVSTGTRTLQDQITRHDVPLLQELMPEPFIAVTLKGVSNYLCLRRFNDLLHRDTLPDGVAPGDLELIAEWAEHTPSGDRADLAQISDDAPIWAQLTETPETRLGPRCPYYERCFVTRARRSAEKAHLILVNHHLFFADLALRANYPGARVLPDYDAVVFDEAHQLEAVITGHFGVRVSTMHMSQLVKSARKVLTGGGLFAPPAGAFDTAERMIAHLDRCAAGFFALVRRHLTEHLPADSDRVELTEALFTDSAREDAWFRLDTALDELGRHAAIEAGETEQAGELERSEEMSALSRRCAAVRDDLAALAEQSAGAFVYWGELRGPGVLLCGAPIDVAPYVRGPVMQHVPATVFTSATLTTGGTFEYVRRRLGLDEDTADALLVESPFDYPGQVMLYVPTDIPEPREAAWPAAACARIAELVAITAGRAFVLFTSHRALRQAARLLPKLVPYPLLIQGERPKTHLLDQFRAQPGAVLLGTGTFWEGVDVPGDALSLVIMDKLPFAPPTDPLIAARMRALEQSHRDPFLEFQVPQAALALKQGFGRLIRRSDDRGIVTILDRRVLSRLYGRVFLDTLPPGVPRTSSIEQIRRWWHREPRSGAAPVPSPEQTHPDSATGNPVRTAPGTPEAP